MSTSHQTAPQQASLIADCDYWLRVNVAVELNLTEALLDVLHNTGNDPTYNGLPRDGQLLYQRMVKFKQTHHCKLKNLNSDQWDRLCPSGVNTVSSNGWDITLIVVVIINCTTLKPPTSGNWKQAVIPTDQSKAAFVIRSRELRNKTKHGGVRDIETKSQFTSYWTNIRWILNGLGYGQSKLIKFDELKTGSLKLYTAATVSLLERWVISTHQDVHDLRNNDIKNFQETLRHITLIVERLEQIELSRDVQRLRTGLNSINVSDQKNHDSTYDDVTNDGLQIVDTMLTREEFRSLQKEGNLQTRRHSKTAKLFRRTHSKDRFKGCHISWGDLKASLCRLKREDILDTIKNQTNITTGIEQALKHHRDELYEIHSRQRFTKPFLDEFGQIATEEECFDEAYVDLAILKGYQTNQNNAIQSDRNYHFNQVNAEKENITINQIFSVDDNYVMISGIAGIGKSTLIDKLTLKWSKGDLLSGKNGTPQVSLLLPIKCRELNTLHFPENERPQDTLKRLFPRLFEEITLDKLQEIGGRTLLLIDGCDDLQCIDKIIDLKKPPIVRFLYELIKPNRNIFGFRKFILVSRPRVSRLLQSALFASSIQPKRVEVCGFNEINVRNYVIKKCKHDPETSQIIIEKIKHSPKIELMVRVPVYLWVICGLYRQDISFDMPVTVTELLLYACLVFIRNHFKELGAAKILSSLREISEDRDVSEYLVRIAEMSFQTLLHKRVIFEACNQSVQQFKELETTGFIERSGKGESGTTLYQFRHLVLQELFTAIHIFSLQDPDYKQNLYQNENLEGCLPLIAGLEGIDYAQESGQEKILAGFLKSLSPGSVLNSNNESNQVAPVLGHVTGLFVKKFAELDTIRITRADSQFLSCLFEHHGKLTTSVTEAISGKLITIPNTTGSQNKAASSHVTFFLHRVAEQCQNIEINELLWDANHPITIKHISSILPVTRCLLIDVTRENLQDVSTIFADTLSDRFIEGIKLKDLHCCIRGLNEHDKREFTNQFSSTLASCIPYFNSLSLGGFTESSLLHFTRALLNSEPTIPLKKLTLSGFDLEECDGIINNLCVTLKSLKLEHLGLQRVLNVTEEHTLKISQTINYLGNNSTLKTLQLKSCGIDDIIIEPLLTCMQHLELLDLQYNNKLTEVSFQSIRKQISLFTDLRKNENATTIKLKQIDLSHNTNSSMVIEVLA